MIGGMIGGIIAKILRKQKRMECSICLEQIYEFGDILPCGHTYHNRCLDKWYYQSVDNGESPCRLICPLCRGVCTAQLVLINYVPEIIYKEIYPFKN